MASWNWNASDLHPFELTNHKTIWCITLHTLVFDWLIPTMQIKDFKHCWWPTNDRKYNLDDGDDDSFNVDSVDFAKRSPKEPDYAVYRARKRQTPDGDKYSEGTNQLPLLFGSCSLSNSLKGGCHNKYARKDLTSVNRLSLFVNICDCRPWKAFGTASSIFLNGSTVDLNIEVFTYFHRNNFFVLIYRKIFAIVFASTGGLTFVCSDSSEGQC